jgi:chlorobactene glucosyltransferase
MWFLVISIAATAIWIASFARGLRDLSRTPHLRAFPAPSPAPFVSVIVPARNEEDAVRECAESLLAQDYPRFEIVAADDHSTDRTWEILTKVAETDKRLKTLKVPALPEGWTGKNFALHTAVAASSTVAEWLLLTDADTVHERHSISSVVAFAESKGLDFVSLFPRAVCTKWWERLLLPSVGAMITLFNSPWKVNDPENRDAAFANGQFILVRRGTYESAGGNESVRDSVLEDSALAGRIKGAGGRTFIAYGEAMYSTRMYHRFREFLEGWSKNLFLIVGARWSRVVGMILTSVLLSWIPLLSLLYGASLLCCRNGLPAWAPFVLIGGYALTLTFQTTLRSLGKGYPAYAALAPFASFITTYLVLRSAYLHTTGRGVKWKGRRYSQT